MYSTVKEIHIALDQKLQQVNSNRKQSFYPEEYDIAINEAIREYVNGIYSAKLNPKGEGAEQSTGRYDELRFLKRELIKKPYLDELNNRVFIQLPANYKTIISSSSYTVYKRNRSIPTTTVNLTAKIFSIPTLFASNPSTVFFNYISGADGRMDANHVDLTSDFQSVETDDGRFMFANRVIDIMQRVGVDAHYENFDGIYKPSCIITNTDVVNGISFDFDSGWPYTTLQYNTLKRINSSIGKIADNDLVPTENIQKLLSNLHSSKNRHLNPISEIINGRLYVYINNDFYVDKIHLTYYKEPSLLNYKADLLPDIPINDSIVDRAARIILGAIKDNFGYQVQSQKQ